MSRRLLRRYHFMGPVFERICIDYLTRKLSMESLPFLVTKIGRWWGSNARKRRQEEIDILAFEERKAIFGECKWTNEPVDMDVYEHLAEKTALFTYKEKYIYLFTKRGFSDRCKRVTEKNPAVQLISFQEMLE